VRARSDRVPAAHGVGGHRRVHDPWAHGVERDAVLHEAGRQRPDEPGDRLLRHRVHRVALERDDAGDRRGGDDRPAAVGPHRRDQGPDAEHDAADVGLHGPLVEVQRQLLDRAVEAVQAGVEVGDVRRAARGRDGTVPELGVGDAAGDGDTADRRRGLLDRVRGEVDRDDLRPLGGEVRRGRPPDAGAGTGHDRDLAGEAILTQETISLVCITGWIVV
jgi:hypothetical protein